MSTSAAKSEAALIAAAERTASVPIVMIRSTPSARAAAMAATASGMRSSGMWQWESAHDTGSGVAGEQRVALLHGEPAGILAPCGSGREPLLVGAAGRADPPPQLGRERRH